MEKSEDDTAVEWLWKVCVEEWDSGQEPGDWTKAVIPLDIGKGSKSD